MLGHPETPVAERLDMPRQVERIAQRLTGIAAFNDRGKIENGEWDHRITRAVNGWDVPRGREDCDRSGGKCEAAAGPAKHQFLRHLLAGEIDKVLPAAMHRHHVLKVELLQLRHDLA